MFAVGCPAIDTQDDEATTVTVGEIDYATTGRWHLRVTLTVLDEAGEPVEGATGDITIVDEDDDNRSSGSATTEEDGTATIQFDHALRDADCYTTTVDDVSGDGIAWDGEYPEGTGNC